MRERLFIALCCAAILSSCKDSAPVNGTESTTTAPGSARYPLEVGKVWHYRGTNKLQNFRPTVIGAQFPDSSWSWDADTYTPGLVRLPNGQWTWCVHIDEGSSSADYYYLLEHDTLFLYAYSGSAQIAPKRSGGIGFTFAGRRYGSAGELATLLRSELVPPRIPSSPLDLIYDPRPPKALVFPLTTGQEWDYSTPQGAFHIGKKVVGTLPLIMGGRLWWATNVLWRWDINNDLRWDDDIEGEDAISDGGILRRSRIVRNLTITTESSPEGIGLIDFSTEYTLTSITGLNP
jgi:hypothetical protein